MKSHTWHEGMTLEETKDLAYWERNMLALTVALALNGFWDAIGELNDDVKSGWYKHEGEGFEGWSRVISIGGGQWTFHVPDDFDLGSLPQIEPNWDGHSTEEKWHRIMDECGCNLDK